MSNENHLTIDAAATVLGVHRRTVFRYIKRGMLASFTHAGRSYIHRDEIENYFARLQHEGDAARSNLERKARKAAA